MGGYNGVFFTREVWCIHVADISSVYIVLPNHQSKVYHINLR